MPWHILLANKVNYVVAEIVPNYCIPIVPYHKQDQISDTFALWPHDLLACTQIRNFSAKRWTEPKSIDWRADIVTESTNGFKTNVCKYVIFLIRKSLNKRTENLISLKLIGEHSHGY